TIDPVLRHVGAIGLDPCELNLFLPGRAGSQRGGRVGRRGRRGGGAGFIRVGTFASRIDSAHHVIIGRAVGRSGVSETGRRHVGRKSRVRTAADRGALDVVAGGAAGGVPGEIG